MRESAKAVIRSGKKAFKADITYSKMQHRKPVIVKKMVGFVDGMREIETVAWR